MSKQLQDANDRLMELREEAEEVGTATNYGYRAARIGEEVDDSNSLLFVLILVVVTVLVVIGIVAYRYLESISV